MVYLKDWSEFESATTKLYAQSPATVRYSVKFRPSEGKLVLKVTDNVKCLQYKTFSSIILNRFESLNLRLLLQMSNARPSSSARIGMGAEASSASASGAAGKAAATSTGEDAADADVNMDGGARAGPGAGQGAREGVGREGSVVPPSGLSGGVAQGQGGQQAAKSGGGKKKKKGKK